MFNFFKKTNDADYNEIVARLTLSVVSILACRNVSATTDEIYWWLYAKDVRNEDDATALADEYEGK
jgi:hypothetical protein